MAEWDDLGISREEYEEAMAGFHDYMQDTGALDAPGDEDMDRMAAEMGEPAVGQSDHVETPAEYAVRMQKEARLFRTMPFEDIVKYRVDNKMILTDADKALINGKIVDEYEGMVSEHDGAMDYYDDCIANADFTVDQYESNSDAQREVAACGGNVPAWMQNEYPIDEHGRAYTAAELEAQYEDAKSDNTRAFEAARERLFARVYDLHVLTTKAGMLPPEVTGGKSASPTITPDTFSVLGSEFKAYHAEQFRQQLPIGQPGRNDVGRSADVTGLSMAMSGSLPVVDFSKSVSTTKLVQPQKDMQVVQQTIMGNNSRQRMADVAVDRQDALEDVAGKRAQQNIKTGRNRGRTGASAFDDHNSVEGGRSNPDYDFDEFD